MGENLRENIPMPSSTDPDPTDCSGCQLTRTNSDSSAITLDTSKDVWLDNARQVDLGKSTEWTDEKHSRYLDSLEASFVDELYHSMPMGGQGMKKNSGRPFLSDQFMVLGEGCWKKINYIRNEPLLDSTADSHVVMESPQIRHFTYSGKRNSVACSDPQENAVFCNSGICSRGKLTSLCGSAISLDYHSGCHKCHQDLVGSSAEVSDQNFVEENSGRRPTLKSISKRLKTAACDGSRNDQIVPSKNFRTADVSFVNNTFSNREEHGQQELLSEHPENFVCPNSDIHYFLRGS